MDGFINSITLWWNSFADDFYQNFIDQSRWQWLINGLLVTLQITIFAALIGIVLGFLVAIVRATADKNIKTKKKSERTFSDRILLFFNGICKIYLTVIRGTPVVVQLLIIYYVVFQSVNIDKILVGIIAFGINSGAYVAEIVRSGIMSIDSGQFEAGRSLGLSYVQTMRHIIMPQALKNVLPALGNEIIVLLKETSVSGYIATKDLTYIGNVIRSITFSSFMPLIAVAVIYLVVVMILTKLVNMLEKRLRNSER